MANYNMDVSALLLAEDDAQKLKEVCRTLVELNDTLRYMFENIDVDNLTGNAKKVIEMGVKK